MLLVDWAVKMRIPEFETSICDAKFGIDRKDQNSIDLGHATAACGGATGARDGARGRATVADEGCATMRERACMAAPDHRLSCAPVPHERRMVCCPFTLGCCDDGRHAGRPFCVRRCDARRHMHVRCCGAGRAPVAREVAVCSAAAGRTLVDGCARFAHGVASPWRGVSHAVAESFVVAARGRPPLRRVSGDVVTAGLISSRLWFGPVPSSP
ncbi:hypothetical protein F511_34343 [Dorcoceras hygrometricum]|uniref:Uncharacterized protein n=1 Tax=Dorcoceras hygrometricum TaxID=472368 RepID=A0A2Z7BMX2_9LAMI|nr:hypothetical protein F511_34343 [Dorcoceras hygrometricum]